MEEAARRVAQIFGVSTSHALPTVSTQTLQRYHAYLQTHLSLPFGRNEMDPPLCGSTSMSHNECKIRAPM